MFRRAIGHGGALLESDFAGDGQNCHAGIGGIAAVGVLREGGGRYGDLSSHRGKGAGGFIVGVVHGGTLARPIQRHGDVAENGIKLIGNHHRVLCGGRLSAEVLDREGVGDGAATIHHIRAHRLGDGQLRRGFHGKGGLRSQRGAAAGDGGGIGDGGIRAQRRKGSDGGLIEQRGAGIGGNADPGDRQGRAGGDGRRGLENAARIIPQRTLHIFEGIPRFAFIIVSAQVIANGDAGHGRVPGVDKVDHIGHFIPRHIPGGNGVLGGGENLHQLSGGDIGIGNAAAVGQGGLIIE